MEEEKRNKAVHILVNSDELSQIKKVAKAENLPKTSVWIRKFVLDYVKKFLGK